MSETKWTPGPWAISGLSMNDGSISIGQAELRIVIAYATNAASFGDFVSAAIRGRRDFGAPDTAATQWANAHLITAAPDLYEALEEMLGEGPGRPPPATCERARTALRKARGEASLT